MISLKYILSIEMDSESYFKAHMLDPSYDADMCIIEHMVMVSRGEDATSLNMRYASEAIEYWRQFERYITNHDKPQYIEPRKIPRVHTPYIEYSDELNKAIVQNLDVSDIYLDKHEFLILRAHRGSNMDRYIYIKKHIDTYKSSFQSLICRLQSDEYKQEIAMAPFVFIAYLNSLDIFPPRYLTHELLEQFNLNDSSKYLLPTRSKYLTYNSYLYSISNGIGVIPIGSDDTIFDLVSRVNDVSTKMDISLIYRRIMTLDIPDDHKKLNIFSTRFVIHDIHTDLYQPTLESSLVALVDVYNKIGSEYVEYYKSDINSFRPIINDKNIKKAYALMKYLMRSGDVSYLDEPMRQIIAGRNPTGKMLFVLILTVSFIEIQERVFGGHIDSITTPIINRL